MRELPNEKRLNDVALLQHRRSIYEVSKFLDISQSTCFRIYREYISYVEPSRGGCLGSITLTQRQVCIRAIIIDRLNNVLDMMNALSEHLNVVVSTNKVK